MLKWPRFVVALLVAPILLALFPIAVTAQGDLVGDGVVEDGGSAEIAELLDPIVRRRGGRIGVAVYAADLGNPLYLHNADLPLTPASNMKLYTTAAALDRLGPDFQYTTSVYADGEIHPDGTLDGDLILIGRGDPTLSGRFHGDSVTYVFDRFAARLKRMGIRRVTGAVVGDATYLDDMRIAPGWDSTNLLRWYGARSSALSFNDNVVTIEIQPGGWVGAPPALTFYPHTDRLEISNQAVTVGRRGGRSIGIRRQPETGDYLVRGRIPLRSRPLRYMVSVEDPALYTTSVFADRLRRVGIEVEGGERVVHRWQREGARSATLLVSHTSPRMSDIVKIINKRSQNFFAEQLLKTLGAVFKADGSFASGAEVVYDVLEGLGLETDGLTIEDGSGLSRLNLLTARRTAELLVAMRAHPLFDEFYESLAIAGKDGNPRRLDSPLVRGNVHSKTGTLRGVSALSGYVTTSDGELLVFSILINNLPRGKWAAMSIEDAIVERLAEFSRWHSPLSCATGSSTPNGGKNCLPEG
jgi:D-alanyl-D-alanine carboxypeptidase/D-alanyl-D-alanine-endopeptidase (penicillin-binding protein 4)